MRPLRVLITNNTLDDYAGTELYVRDLATGLLERGHLPVAYSSRLGAVAEELRRATVPVVHDLDALGTPPDLIHGHHHVETMTALLRFPQVPALYYCHGWLPWEEMPPRFPRILRYIAVDNTCRDRLTCEGGIPVERVRVVLNFVDLKRFLPRPPLPRRPGRALVFSNNACRGGYLATVEKACAQVGMELDVIGMAAGTACSRPEEVLGRYDLVFAKARAALEALATGAAVILCDQAGAGPLVTCAELDRLRLLNFGIRCLRQPVTTEVLLQAINGYDPEDAAEVSRQIRATAGRDSALDQILALYEDVLEASARSMADPQAEAQAAAAYLREVSPNFQQRSAHQFRLECACLRSQLDRLHSERDRAAAEKDQLTSERDYLQGENQRLEAARGSLQAERDSLTKKLDQLRFENQRLIAERDRLHAETNRVALDRDLLRCQRDGLQGALVDAHNSVTLRLRAWLLGVPFLGRITRSAARGIRMLDRLMARRPRLLPDKTLPRGGAAGRPHEPRGARRGQQMTDHPPMPIIVGVARSGTTLLRLMLDAHPELAIPAETGFIPAVHQLVGAGASLRQAFFDTVTAAPTWEDLRLSKQELWEGLQQIEPFDVSAGVRCFYASYARLLGKTRWGDKTPLYGRQLRIIQEVLPEAHFLHIIRDGRDVALSLRGLWFAPGDSAAALAQHWCEQIAATREQASTCRHYLEIRYEDLIGHTRPVLQQICRFLGLPFDRQMENYHQTARLRLDEVRTRYNSDGSVVITKEQRLHLHRLTQRTPDASRIGQWKTGMGDQDLRAFESIGGGLLRRLGYETVSAAGLRHSSG
jgi:hypothetical protein